MNLRQLHARTSIAPEKRGVYEVTFVSKKCSDVGRVLWALFILSH